MEKEDIERLKIYIRLLYSLQNDKSNEKVDELYLKYLKAIERSKDNERKISK